MCFLYASICSFTTATNLANVTRSLEMTAQPQHQEQPAIGLAGASPNAIMQTSGYRTALSHIEQHRAGLNKAKMLCAFYALPRPVVRSGRCLRRIIAQRR